MTLLQTPVAFFIFNRPQITSRVFAEIARAKPLRLLVVADGPRSSAEAEKCAATRAIIEQVDWECEVLTNFSDANLGCRRRVSSGLDWVFERCEEAIILEDDCLPHPTLFRYCAELLEKYRHDERVMMISGNNFQFGRKRTPYSYYFSRYPHLWGWASWRRAWQHYDVEMKLWPVLRETSWPLDILGDAVSAEYWRNIFDKKFAGQMDAVWDYQWVFACWAQNGLAVLPNINLVANIGFGEDATRTKTDISAVANLPTGEMIFPLQHPPYMVRDRESDQFTFGQIFARELEPRGLYPRLRRKLAAVLPGPVRALIASLRVKTKAGKLSSV